MTTEFKRIATIEVAKPPYDEYFVTVDISTWLDTDEIQGVVFSAKDSAGADATATVLDPAKNTNTTTIIKPYLKGGVSGTTYTVILKVSTSDGDNVEFYLVFMCKEEP